MSLLLDALKRAEQEKLARQGEASNDSAPGMGAEASASSSARGGSLELQPLGAAASAPPARSEESSQAAQALFDAKQPSAEARRSRSMLWVTLGVIAVVVASAAAYVWYQIQMLTAQPVPVATRRPPPPPLQTSTGSPPPTTPLPETTPRTPATVTVMPELVPPVAPRTPVATARAQATPPEDPVTKLLREAPAAPSEAAPVKLARTLDKPRISPDVSTGYAALRRGELAQARTHYENALTADPRSLDARLGMATIEAKGGNRSLAAAHYRRVLEADPRNATALAGLAALAEGAASPDGVEAQLREDIARFPDSAALHFALGGHFAGQARWGEAQSAFFEAYRLEPASADIAYNLAVSLDHMGQQRLAADFYRRALEGASAQATQFDPASAQRRLAEIADAR
jgi:tetratricopeptide (TPR) repeat protein